MPLGRSLSLKLEAAQQLLGTQPSLGEQLVGAVELQRAEMLEFLSRVSRPNYTHRRGLEAPLLLLEGEHPAWPLLALAQGGVLSAENTAQQLRSAVRLSSEARAGGQTLAYWLADALLSVAEALLLGYWGVLLTYASLQRADTRPERIQGLARQLEISPGLLEQPSALCVQVLWAALYWMHGGQQLAGSLSEAQGQILALVGALPTLAQHTTTQPMPSENKLQEWLAHWLPALSAQQRQDLIRQWQSLPPPEDHAYLSGITALRVPGQVALWRRSRAQLHVIVLSSPASTRPLAWQWQLA